MLALTLNGWPELLVETLNRTVAPPLQGRFHLTVTFLLPGTAFTTVAAHGSPEGLTIPPFFTLFVLIADHSVLLRAVIVKSFHTPLIRPVIVAVRLETSVTVTGSVVMRLPVMGSL
jgi:hypothetical protein